MIDAFPKFAKHFLPFQAPENIPYSQRKCIASPTQTPHYLVSCAGPDWNKGQRCEWQVAGAIKPTWFQTGVAWELKIATCLGEGYSDQKPHTAL